MNIYRITIVPPQIAALGLNSIWVNNAQVVVKALSASRKRKRAAASCTEVNTVAGTLTALVTEFPWSPQVLVYSAEITASSNLVCTDAEKVSLVEMNAKFDKAVDTIVTAIWAAQEQYAYFIGAEQPLRAASRRKMRAEAATTTTTTTPTTTTTTTATATTTVPAG